jgi:hypothetical protein
VNFKCGKNKAVTETNGHYIVSNLQFNLLRKHWLREYHKNQEQHPNWLIVVMRMKESTKMFYFNNRNIVNPLIFSHKYYCKKRLS